jgi:hypothetical protein
LKQLEDFKVSTLLTNGKAHETLQHLFGLGGEQTMAKVLQRLSPTKG